MKNEQNRKNRKAIAIAMVALLVIPALMISQAQAQWGKAAWQMDVDWASRDTGAPDCPWLYAPVPDCLGGGVFSGNRAGNRSCVIGHARQLAFAGQDVAAFGLVLITQCHNQGEEQNLMAAGPFAVGNYLRNPY